uniref:Uncharacterized protein n=1 Tax=Arundo donax TaxID=35708 RepID=A0A0A9DTB4_ARUDO
MNGGCCETSADCAVNCGCPPSRRPPNCGGPPNGSRGCCGAPKLCGIGWDEAAPCCPGNVGRGPPNSGGAGCEPMAGEAPKGGGCDTARGGPPNGGA